MKRASIILLMNIVAMIILSSLSLAEEDINELVSKGIQNYQQENFKTSYEYFRRAMKINPLHPEASQWYWKIKSERDVKNLTDKSPSAEAKKDKPREVIEKTPEKTPDKERERPDAKKTRPDAPLNKEINNKIKLLDNRVVTLLKKIDEQKSELEIQNAKEKEDLKIQTSALSRQTTILVAVLGSISIVVIVFTFAGITWSRKKFKRMHALKRTDEGMVRIPALVSAPADNRMITDNRMNSMQLARKLLNSEADLMNNFNAPLSRGGIDPLSSLAREYFENNGNLLLLPSGDPEHAGIITSASEYYRRLEIMVAGFVYLIEKKLNRVNNDSKVSELCNKVGKELGLTSVELINLRLGALLKDIGFLLIPEEIYFKPGKLTESERNQMRKHVNYSLKIAKLISMTGGVLEALINHHELYDSSGYPSGIGGNDIPLNSRIISICDSYVSLTSDRPHRKALGTGKAEKIIEKESSFYDPNILDAFFEIVHDKKD